MLGEGQVPPPQQTEHFRAGYEHGYSEGRKRPVRRGK